MKVLVVGSGGREHALCWSIARSPLCTELLCAPGNAGIAQVAHCVDVGAENVEGLVRLARRQHVDFVVVGPEAPLVKGLVDRLTAAGIKTFGPTAAAAAIEGSKVFMKDLCARYGIPTAGYARFDEPDEAKEYIHRHGAPIVVKADGLAAGKGVMVCRNENEAFAAIDHMMIETAFGAAGQQVVIEDFLEGEEVSFFALVNGPHAIPFATAQDHKAAFDGDQGPNTGGMGAYSPAPVMTPEMAERVMRTIIQPTAMALATEHKPYVGVLFAGLMMTASGPVLLEYNVRFGDPECQPILMRLKSDLLAALIACVDDRLEQIHLEWEDDPALLVVLATHGYPGHYAKGSVIRGLDQAAAVDGATLFHAGTRSVAGRTLAHGGRVLGIGARGPSFAEAQRVAYEAVDRIDWPEGFCRRDIGWRAVGEIVAMTTPIDRLDPQTRLELEAAAFRGLVAHLQRRTDAQNIDLMNLAGFCRNCLAKWVLAAAKERGLDATYEDARTFVYGEPFADWKRKHQTEATEEQQRQFEETKPLHAVIESL